MDIFCTYEQHFGLSGHPFNATPDPDFHFESHGHARALAHLQLAVRRRECFMVLTGESGAGKTVLVRKLLRGLEAEGIVAALPSGTAFDRRTVLLAILAAFHAPVHDESLDALRERLRAFLDTLRVVGRSGLVVLDEAQHLLPDTIEELVALATPHADGRPTLQVLLAGQPELRGKLPPGLHLRREPCFVFCDLGLFSEEETRAYIEHRLRRVQWHESPAFDGAAYARIHQATGGVPRHINRLCHRLLMTAAQQQLDEVSAELVDETSVALREELGEVAPPQAEFAEEAVAAAPPAACVRARPGRSTIATLYTPDDEAFESPGPASPEAHALAGGPIAETLPDVASPPPTDPPPRPESTRLPWRDATSLPWRDSTPLPEPPPTIDPRPLPDAAAPPSLAAALAEDRAGAGDADAAPFAARAGAVDPEPLADAGVAARTSWRPGSRTLWVAGGVAMLVFGVLLGSSAYLQQQSLADAAAAAERDDPGADSAADGAPASEALAGQAASTPGNATSTAAEPRSATAAGADGPTEPARPGAASTAVPAMPADAARVDTMGDGSAGPHSLAVAAAPVATAPFAAPPVAAPPVAAPPVTAPPVAAPPVATAPVATAPVATASVAAAPVAVNPRAAVAQTARIADERPRTTRRSAGTRRYATRPANPSATGTSQRAASRPIETTSPTPCTPAVAALGLCAPPRAP